MEQTLARFYYNSKIVFEKEQKIFAHSWHLACTTYDLPQNNDWLTVRIASEEIFIQRFSEGIKAFSNVCIHRYSRIRSSAHGNGPIVCPYHGWVYKSDGSCLQLNRELANENLIKCSETRPKKLTEWQVEIIGPLVFVKQKKTSRCLCEELEADSPEILKFMSALGEQTSKTTHEFDANWKIAVENTLESYHVQMVHPESFAKVGATGHHFEFMGPNSSWHAVLPSPKPRQKQLLDLLDDRIYQVDGYRHFNFFPFVTLATTGGLTFSVQAIHVISPSKTLFVSWVFGPIVANLSKEKQYAIQALCAAATEFNQRVFQEDKTICQEVHKGSQINCEAGFLMPQESRVAHFQKKYLEILSD
jgi:phenylpropionate dioxygenase-like ring-hydroxylating dioxygenase large terminal subunit